MSDIDLSKGHMQRPGDIDKFKEGWDRIFGKKADADPCPGCRKGGVCRTPKCGRLKKMADQHVEP